MRASAADHGASGGSAFPSRGAETDVDAAGVGIACPDSDGGAGALAATVSGLGSVPVSGVRARA